MQLWSFMQLVCSWWKNSAKLPYLPLTFWVNIVPLQVKNVWNVNFWCRKKNMEKSRERGKQKKNTKKKLLLVHFLIYQSFTDFGLTRAYSMYTGLRNHEIEFCNFNIEQTTKIVCKINVHKEKTTRAVNDKYDMFR